MAPITFRQTDTVDEIVVRGEGIVARFSGQDLQPRGAHVALWFALPLAMRMGRDLYIDGAVCPVALNNARRLATIWSNLAPQVFEPIEIEAQVLNPDQIPASDRRIMAFSGGVDSSTALLNLHHNTGERPDLLTIQGLDYRLSDKQRFQHLLNKTAQFRAEHGNQQRILRTDAGTSYRAFKVPISISFGFLLAACLGTHEKRYKGGIIASDVAQCYECTEGVYGTSSGVTPLMSSATFQTFLADLNLSRFDKLPILAADPIAINSVSCCEDYQSRPHNCGVCAKCVRTKGNFLAAIRTIPDMFPKPGLDPEDFDAIDLRAPVYAQSWNRMVARAKENGTDAV